MSITRNTDDPLVSTYHLLYVGIIDHGRRAEWLYQKAVQFAQEGPLQDMVHAVARERPGSPTRRTG